jgi:hypothetical protein
MGKDCEFFGGVTLDVFAPSLFKWHLWRYCISSACPNRFICFSDFLPQIFSSKIIIVL